MSEEFFTEREKAIEILDDQILNAIHIHGGGMDGLLFATFWQENNLSNLPSFFTVRADERAVSDAGIEEWQLIFYGPRASGLYTKLIPDRHPELPYRYRTMELPFDESDVFSHRRPVATGEPRLARAKLAEIAGLTTLLETGPVKLPILTRPNSFREALLEPLRTLWGNPTISRKKKYGD